MSLQCDLPGQAGPANPLGERVCHETDLIPVLIKQKVMVYEMRPRFMCP
jgi:hypothetical protein